MKKQILLLLLVVLSLCAFAWSKKTTNKKELRVAVDQSMESKSSNTKGKEKEDIMYEKSVYYIKPEVAAKIKPVIEKWLDYYDLDINLFAGEEKESVDIDKICVNQDTLSMYYREYEERKYDPILYDYSPNKQYDLNVRSNSGVYLEEDGKYYYYGGDDCQEIRLTNHKLKNNCLIQWNGTSEFSEAAFWLDNNTFIIVGRNNYAENEYTINITGEISGSYSYQSKHSPKEESYFRNDVKSRGVIFDW